MRLYLYHFEFLEILNVIYHICHLDNLKKIQFFRCRSKKIVDYYWSVTYTSVIFKNNWKSQNLLGKNVPENLFSLQGCLLEFSGIVTVEILDFSPLNFKIRGWFCVRPFDILKTFYSVSNYFSNTVKISIIYWLHSAVGSSQCLRYQNSNTFSKKITICTKY